MRAWAAALLLAGCTAATPDPGLTAAEALDHAWPAAQAWDADAELWAALSFEADTNASSRLTAVYDVPDPAPGDGHALRWTFAFRAPALLPVGEQPSYVVHVGPDGVLDSYETTREDEGALGRAPLEAWPVGSAEAADAAARAKAGFRDHRGDPAWTGALFLLQGGTEGGHDGPMWDLLLRSPDGESHEATVDARTGQVL